MTAIRKVIWRVTGTLIANITTSLVAKSLGNMIHLFHHTTWSRMYDFISCFFTAGSMIAGLLDLRDGKFDGWVKL